MTIKNRIHLKAGKRSKLTHAQRSYLLEGIDLGQFDSEAAAREAWRANRAELLAAWIAENPGRRPDMWWQLEAPNQLRRQLAGPEPLAASPIHHGCPSWWPCKNLIFEPEVEFLHRHSLLTREVLHQYPALKQRARDALKKEALARSASALPRAGSLTLPCAIYSEEELDQIFKDADELTKVLE